MKKVIKYINKLNTNKFILISTLISLAFAIPINFIKFYFNKDFGGIDGNGLTPIELYFIVIVVGPIIESVLIVIITKVIGIFTKNKVKITFITAILFACMHTYSWVYIMQIFIPSLIFVYAYVLYDNENNKLNPFLIMTIIHVSYNLMQIISNILLITLIN